MKGRRVSRDDVQPWEMEPGDYMLAKDGVVWVRLPNGVGPSRLDGWAVTHHDDDTLTVMPSILDNSSGWHGFLECGIWREV